MLELYADGGCIGGNPGRAIYASLARLDEDFEPEVLVHRREWDYYHTNNQAEFMAVRLALDYALELEQYHEPQVRINMDSKLVVNCMNGIWQASHPNIRDLYRVAIRRLVKLRRDGRTVNIVWRPRRVLVRVLGH